MAVMMPRQNWTDERLDHFEKRVDERFDRVDERLDNFEAKVDERFQRVDERFKEADKRLERIEMNFSELQAAMLVTQRVMTHGFIAICTVMAGGFAAMAGVIG